MVEWEPLIELKGNKGKKQYDQRKRFKDYADKVGGFHCSRRQGTIVTLCYFLAGVIIIFYFQNFQSTKKNFLEEFEINVRNEILRVLKCAQKYQILN